MAIPGFNGELSIGPTFGTYGGSPRAGLSPAPDVAPQLKSGGLGPIFGYCCCFRWPEVFNAEALSARSRQGGDAGPTWATGSGGFAAGGFNWGWGGFGISCVSCPEGSDQCGCRCQANGLPCCTCSYPGITVEVCVP